MDYQWDPKKADLNSKKHGIDFADAVGVFEDEWALTIKQQIVRTEQRFATVGMDFLGRLVVVVYTYRGDNIRLISARPAKKAERNSMNKEEYNFEKAKQGPVAKPSPGKTRITIRVDTDILNWFRKQVHKRGGGNYQTLINDALREYTNFKDSDLEKTVRKVIREELKVLAK